MIEIRNVEKRFGHLRVLNGVTMDVSKGEVVSIIGGSGFRQVNPAHVHQRT